MDTAHAQVEARFHEAMKAARATYGAIPDIALRFDLRGTCAGQYRADHRGRVIRINPEAMRVGLEHVLNETVPHEVAHYVAHVTGQGRGHDAGWRRIARSLGCKGNRCHSLALKPARAAHLYRTESGRDVWLSKRYHMAAQAGVVLKIRSTGEAITAACYVEAGK